MSRPLPFAHLLRVTVGSTSPPKVAAVRAALVRFGAAAPVTGVEVPSGVSPQPIGLDEISAGARNRARAAFAHDAGRGAQSRELAVGIEDGLAVFDALDTQPFNVACAVVTDGRRESAALSSAFAYPADCAQPALDRRVPIGEVFDEFWRRRSAGRDAAPSGREEGNVGKLTFGVLTREEYARHAVICALIRFLHPDLYFTDSQPAETAGIRNTAERKVDE